MNIWTWHLASPIGARVCIPSRLGGTAFLPTCSFSATVGKTRGRNVFRPRVFPTVALKEQVGKKAVPPSRLGIQTRAPIGEARCQVQIFMSELEPRLSLVRVQQGDLAALSRGASEVLQVQVARS